MPLTDTKIKSLGPGTALYRVADEKGLCIEVPPVGARRWRVRYRFGQKAGMLSVGTYPEVSLKQARARRDEIRRQIEQGIDPSAAREAAKDALAGEGSFDALAREWYHQYAPGWNPAHASRIWRRLEVEALGLNHWIDPSVESMGEFYWGDENADDAGLPDLWFP